MKTKINQSIKISLDTGIFQLDIYTRHLDIYFTFSNDWKGIYEAIKAIKKHQPGSIVIEATGCLEMHIIVTCAKHVYPS
jgi:transposase